MAGSYRLSTSGQLPALAAHEDGESDYFVELDPDGNVIRAH